MEETDFCRTSYGRNGVLLIGRVVAYRKTEEADLCWSASVETRVLFIGWGVAYRKIGIHWLLFIHHLLPGSILHGLLFIHRRPPPASTYDYSSTGSCSFSLHRVLLHRLLFSQHSPRGSCSTTPPWATVHPALHRVLFIQPSTGSCSSSSNGLYYHGVLFIQPPKRELFIQRPQQRTLFIQRQYRSASVSKQ